MKTPRVTPTIIAPLILAGLLVWGCSTANRVTYQAVGTSRVTVQEAMGLWNQYVGDFHPGTNAEYNVMHAFQKWQVGQVAVCDAGVLLATAEHSGAGTNGISAASVLLQTAIANAAQEQTDLFTLLTTYGVKLP